MRLLTLWLSALGILASGLGAAGCASDESMDPFRRIVASEREIFVLHPGGVIATVTRPREFREFPRIEEHPVGPLDGLGAIAGGRLWYSDRSGIAPFAPAEASPDDYIPVERLLGLPEEETALWSITTIDSFENLLWIGLAPWELPDEQGQPVQTHQPSVLAGLDVTTGRVLHRLQIRSPVLDAEVRGDRLVLLLGPMLFSGGGPTRVESRSVIDGKLLAVSDEGLGSAAEFDRWSNGDLDLWLSSPPSEAIRRFDPRTGRPGRTIAIPCKPELVLSLAMGLVIACSDRPALLLQPRRGGDPNELPLEGNAAADVQAAAGAVWVVGTDGHLTRLPERDLPWPE